MFSSNFHLSCISNKILRLKNPILRILSIGFFSLSILFDMHERWKLLENITELFHENRLIYRIGEDGSKFVGIWSWAVFHVRAAWTMSIRA